MKTEVSCQPDDQPCILIVDDDADLMAFLFSVLVREGFSIVAASDGQQALDLLEHGLRPHLILIDLMLPRVSGMDLLNHIRTDPSLRTIPRVVITGASEHDSLVADAVFEKPFDHNELLTAIHRLVGAIEPKSSVVAGQGSPATPDRRSVRKHPHPVNKDRSGKPRT